MLRRPGGGHSKENLAKIFDPFFTTEEVGKGTGLGLATVQNIMQTQEGFLTVDTEVRAGTTFTLYFPARADPMPVAAAAPEELPGGRGELILLVDDETSILEITRQTL